MDNAKFICPDPDPLGHSSVAGPQKSISSGGPIPCGSAVISGDSQNGFTVLHLRPCWIELPKFLEGIFHYSSADYKISFHFACGFVLCEMVSSGSGSTHP